MIDHLTTRDMTETTTLASQANVDLGHADEVIQSIYKQVFGFDDQKA